MKNLLFTLALLISFVSFGQDDIKQGLVIDYYESGGVRQKGNYVDGKAQGEYIVYYESGGVSQKGNFVDGKRHGEEIFYYKSGEIKEMNFYDGGWLIDYGTFTLYPEDQDEVIEVEDIVIEDVDEDVEVPFSVIENVPEYPGCEKGSNSEKRKCMSAKIAKFVQRKFNTDLAGDLGLSGRQRINVIFKIDKSGNVVGVRSRAPHPRLEKEAARVINMLPKMKPGRQRGKAVVVPYSLPITFQVQD